MDPGGHEIVPEGVHLDHRREFRRVPEIVGVDPLGERRAGGRLDGDDSRIFFPAILSRRKGSRSRRGCSLRRSTR